MIEEIITWCSDVEGIELERGTKEMSQYEDYTTVFLHESKDTYISMVQGTGRTCNKY